MRCELIDLNKYEAADDPVELDDYSSGSYAVYRAHNPARKSFVYFEPDEAEVNEPRCDYILTSEGDVDFATRFIELKGTDAQRQNSRCCSSEWDHAFHQLSSTFDAFKQYMEEHERILFVLCTSTEKKRVVAQLKKYSEYRRLKEKLLVNGLYDFTDVRLFYKDEYDRLN